MSKLMTEIKTQRTQAMKDKDKPKLATLRALINEVEVEMKTTGATEISDAQVETVISRQLKKLGKETETYASLGQDTSKQEAEKELLLSYLPKQLTEDEIRNEVLFAIDLTKKGEIKNPMQYLSKNLKGKADMGLVGKIVREQNTLNIV